MSWINLSEFREFTKINSSIVADEIITRALKNADNWIRNNVLKQEVTVSNKPGNTQNFLLNGLRISDYYSMDGVIDKDDFYIFEKNNVTKEIINLTAKIDNINEIEGTERFGILKFINDDVYPSENCTLYIKTYLCKDEFSLLFEDFKKLEEMLAVQYILQITPAETLQDGISNWTLNGVSVGSGISDINNYLLAYEKAIFTLKENLTPLFIYKTEANYRDFYYRDKYRRW